LFWHYFRPARRFVTLAPETLENSARDQPKVAAILLDIEGTTTPIAFVHEVLFPFARARVGSFLTAHWDSADVSADIALLRAEHATDFAQGLTPPSLIESSRATTIESITKYAHWLIDQDRKSTGLKSLQGKIWKSGYLDGTLKAPVFADVPPALERWRREGLKVGIFSSGSVLAQKLLFAHTENGDLGRFIDFYFDTTTGSKTSIDSYLEIAAKMGANTGEFLFISDVVGELDAAAAAGMQTLLSLRPGNSPQPPGVHKIVRSFAEIT
jgi:enolase-phosphatase E1